MAQEKKPLNLSAIKHLIPERASDAYKNLFGHVLIIAGNEAMGGAAQMAGMAVVNSGAGLTTIATDKVNLPAIHTVLPEAMIIDWTDKSAIENMIDKADVILIGPGFGMDNKGLWLYLKCLLKQSQRQLKIILDADALNLLAYDLKHKATVHEIVSPNIHHQIILTPHIGEWRRLTDGRIANGDQVSVQAWVDQQNVTLVLKGAPTEIYFPNKNIIWQNTLGNPGMAIGGMGDTLAGMIAGLVGQFTESHDAIKFAVFLHSYIGDKLYEDQYIVLPSRLSEEIPRAMKEIVKIK